MQMLAYMRNAGISHAYSQGLELRALIIIGCESSLAPLALAIGQASDAAEFDSLLDMEKRLLCVAATRAGKEPVLTSFGRSSSFLQFAREECFRTTRGATSLAPIKMDHLPDFQHRPERTKILSALAASPVRHGRRSPEAVELPLRARPAFGHREIAI